VLIPQGQLRIWLYVPPTDLRKSFDGLSALVRTKLQDDPLSGQLFVFLNRRRTQVRILYFDRSGYCVWAKRLEQGRFHSTPTDAAKQRLSWSDLQLILEGIDTRSVRRFKRFSLSSERVCGVS
jgi:transposase